MQEGLRQLFVDRDAIGIGGSRAPLDASRHACVRMLPHLIAWCEASHKSVNVGDARGIDHLIQTCLGDSFIRLFDVPGVRTAPRLAQRTVACITATATGLQPLWIGLPKGACPEQVQPSANASACFNGSGNGTWAGLAYAVGLLRAQEQLLSENDLISADACLRVLVYVSDVALPDWGWEVVRAAEAGWFCITAKAPYD